MYCIPRATLHRHSVYNNLEKNLGRFKPVFTTGEELSIKNHLKDMDRVFFGLTLKSLQVLSFEFAQQNNIVHPFVDGKAGKGWIRGFMARHPDLSLRTLESTSIAKAMGVNRPQVYRYFRLLRTLYLKHKLRSQDIYNCDETGIQTSANRLPKVISVNGNRQVAERGKTVIAMCCCTSEERFIPPALIFSKKRMVDRLMNGAPPGSIGVCSDSGWMNTALFVKWLSFFEKHVKPTKETPALLIVDNHESHRSI